MKRREFLCLLFFIASTPALDAIKKRPKPKPPAAPQPGPGTNTISGWREAPIHKHDIVIGQWADKFHSA